LIRLVVVASSSVLSADDETKTIRKKHESSLLEVFSDVGSTPTASTIYNYLRFKDIKISTNRVVLILCYRFEVAILGIGALRQWLSPRLTVFVRHSADCSHKGEEFYRRCRCPKHLRFTHEGKQRRESAKTRSWEIAEEKRREREAQFKAADPSQPIEAITVDAESRPTIGRAVELFVSDKRSQGVHAEVLQKYERELARLKDFMAKRSKFFPHEIGLADLTEFRAGWERIYPSSTTRSKVQERYGAFSATALPQT
jgi:hypothetical protein